MMNLRNLALCTGAALLAAIGGVGAALSLAAAAGAVLSPQAVMLSFAGGCSPQTAFSLWAGKFSVTILLLAVGARVLHTGDLWVAEYFIAGVVLATALNTVSAVRRS